MKLYNSLSNQLETFRPTEDNHVKMYVCGITPYDTTHLGHAFTYMTFDVLHRYLKHQGYTTTYVQNVTDIDDDVLKRAKEVNQDWRELGKFWTQKFLHDYESLNMSMPTHYVKATETMTTIIEIVTALQQSGFAYEKDGNVYFDTKKDKEYGKLSKYTREEMLRLSKERGADPADLRKKDPLDFLMWQKSLPDEPYWHSPWGYGRPGWHIECSAMIYKYLYNYVDIHGGGSDLIYPHHESEIAQSEHFTGTTPFSKFWMHTGAVGYKGEKMSKSLGNLVMISDLLKTYSPNAIRYLLLSHHYREPWEFHTEAIETAEHKINSLLSALTEKQAINHETEKKLNSALQNDLDTPQALAVIEQTIQQKDHASAKKMLQMLGFTF